MIPRVLRVINSNMAGEPIKQDEVDPISIQPKLFELKFGLTI